MHFEDQVKIAKLMSHSIFSCLVFFPLYIHPVLDHQARLVSLYELESSGVLNILFIESLYLHDIYQIKGTE